MSYYKKSTVNSIASYFEKRGAKRFASSLKTKNIDNVILSSLLNTTGKDIDMKSDDWEKLFTIIHRSEDGF